MGELLAGLGQMVLGFVLLFVIIYWVKSIEGKPGRRNDDDNYGSTGYNTWE